CADRHELAMRGEADGGAGTGAAADVSEYAALERVVSSFKSPLSRECSRTGGQRFAELLGVKWPEFRRWLWDTATTPAEASETLAKKLGQPPAALLRQDWDAAAAEA